MPKDAYIRLRLSSEEKELLQTAAPLAGMSMSALLLYAGLRYAKRIKKKS